LYYSYPYAYSAYSYAPYTYGYPYYGYGYYGGCRNTYGGLVPCA